MIKIETTSKLVSHLKSADFFEVEKYPGSEFAITSVVFKGDNKVDITGNLTMKRIAKISLPLQVLNYPKNSSSHLLRNFH